MSYETRLAKLEATLPGKEPLCCYIWGDEDEAVAVARFRAARNWPDDGDHPVMVERYSWLPPVDPPVDQ